MNNLESFPANTFTYRPYLSAVLIVLLALLILMARSHRGESQHPASESTYVGDFSSSPRLPA